MRFFLLTTLFTHVYSMVVNNITFPTSECGYNTIVYNDSLSNFNMDDNVWFYNTNSVESNCGPQNTTLGCVHLQYMTGPFSIFGYNPYTIWYYPYPVNDSFVMNLFYKFEDGDTIMLGSVPCDGNSYQLGLTNCAFNKQLFSYQFYKYFRFDFFANCTFNGTTMGFVLDESVDTCVGFDDYQKCIVNHNSINLVNFQDWEPVPFNYSHDTSNFGVYPTTTLSTIVPTITETQSVTLTINITVTETQNITQTETQNITQTETQNITQTGLQDVVTITETGSPGLTITETQSGSLETVTVTITETGEPGLTITETQSGLQVTITETGSQEPITITVTVTESETTTTDSIETTLTTETSETIESLI
jgi:hypothetical protein